MKAERILHLRWEHVTFERGLIFMPDAPLLKRRCTSQRRYPGPSSGKHVAD